MKKKIEKLIADIALKSAKSAAGAASEWHVYQPKEPAILRSLFK